MRSLANRKRTRRLTRGSSWSLFDAALGVQADDIEFLLSQAGHLPWAEYILNPRRLRGSDFLMRWSQGRWSEDRIVEAVNDTGRFIALPYGPSGLAPRDDIGELERYFDRLEAAGLGKMKRPDLLVLPSAAKNEVEKIVMKIGGPKELAFTPERHPLIRALLSLVVVAIECENSLWVAKKMPYYGADLTPQPRLGGKPGLKKTAVVPTIILKDEDRKPLREWQRVHGIPIHIWHLFYEVAFGISLDDAERLIRSGYIEKTEQVFQAPSGPTTRKAIYKIYYHYGYLLSETVEAPTLVAASITDKNGHILPYVTFQGGKLALSQKALDVLEKLAQRKSRETRA